MPVLEYFRVSCRHHPRDLRIACLVLSQAEEEAWARLPTDVPCPPESEAFVQDVEHAGGRGTEGYGSGEPRGAGKKGGRDVGESHTELEIEIPACEENLARGMERGASRGTSRESGDGGTGSSGELLPDNNLGLAGRGAVWEASVGSLGFLRRVPVFFSSELVRRTFPRDERHCRVRRFPSPPALVGTWETSCYGPRPESLGQ